MSRISNSLVSVTQPARVTSTSEQSQSAESRDRWLWRIHLKPHKSIVKPLKYEERRKFSGSSAWWSPCFTGQTAPLWYASEANGVAVLEDLNAAPAQLCHPLCHHGTHFFLHFHGKVNTNDIVLSDSCGSFLTLRHQIGQYRNTDGAWHFSWSACFTVYIVPLFFITLFSDRSPRWRKAHVWDWRFHTGPLFEYGLFKNLSPACYWPMWRQNLVQIKSWFLYCCQVAEIFHLINHSVAVDSFWLITIKYDSALIFKSERFSRREGGLSRILESSMLCANVGF